MRKAIFIFKYPEVLMTPNESAARTPTLSEIFIAFTKVALSGFGGVLPISRHMLVEQEKWLTEKEFAEQLAIAQLLPGPNIVNLSVGLGDRFHGVLGSLAAVGGLFCAPFMLFMLLAWGYHFFSDSIWLKKALLGSSAAAAGLIIATALKLSKAMLRAWWPWIIAALAFLGIVVYHRPLYEIVGVLGLAAIGLAYLHLSKK